MELREYQKEAVKNGLDYVNSDNTKPGVIVAPTAAGKSLIISKIAKNLKEPVLVLQPNKELLIQNLEKLESFNGEATVYSASLDTKEVSHLTYATLGSIKDKADVFKKIGVKTVLIDEAHRGYSPEPSKMFRKFIDKLKPKKVIGFTATPFRLKQSLNQLREPVSKLNMLNRSKPKYFKDFIHITQISTLLENNYWSPIEYKNYKFDESGLELNSSGSEFTDNSISKAVQEQGVNNSILKRIRELQKDKNNRILVFLDCVDNCKIMNDYLKNSAYLESNTPKKKRSEIIRKYKNGDIQVLLNHAILGIGFDYPELNNIIIGRPTNSLAVYYQVVGRGVRIHENKNKCVIEDFCGNVNRFGKVEDITIENYSGYGWGVFNGNRLLTGIPVGGVQMTKEKLNDKTKTNKIWFGKYKGFNIEDLPSSYVEWLKNWLNTLTEKSSKLENLEKKLKNK